MYLEIDKQTLSIFNNIKSYLEANNTLSDLYQFDYKNFDINEVIKERKEFTTDRNLLVEILKEQYQKVERPFSKVYKNIDALALDTTFTITTGQQIVLLGGPLYVLYKALHTIIAAEKLQKETDNYKIVPVFWMATEDHDFEEINNFNYENKNYSWQLENSEQKGAVGNLITDNNLKETLKKIKNQLPKNLISNWQKIENQYLNSETISNGFRNLLNEWLGPYGLIILDANHHKLKEKFTSILKRDILEQATLHQLEKSSKEMIGKNLKANALHRPVNCFYLTNEGRYRIEFFNNEYVTIGFNKKWTKENLTIEIEKYPENFSPNVLLRPIYQEIILPNLMYIGGSAEVNYWLQLKNSFDYYKVFYPILQHRVSVVLLSNKALNYININKLSIKDFINKKNNIVEKIVPKNTLNKLFNHINSNYENYIHKLLEKETQTIEITLSETLNALSHRQQKQLEHFKNKLYKALKKKHQQEVNKLLDIQNTIYPNNIFQERHDYIFNYQLKESSFIDKLYTTLKDKDLNQLIITTI